MNITNILINSNEETIKYCPKMDGSSVDHSDSDSGESWTLLENNALYADEAPDLSQYNKTQGDHCQEKDEDTDGISIISDSDHDAPSPPPDCSLYDKCEITEELPLGDDISTYVSVDPHLANMHTDNDQEASDPFLRDSHIRGKTYVHRRNKRLSAVLNIIVLGSVITAAGVAIGHMWGAKNDCFMQPALSVNKILSNLYKLQEENAYLRSKLKELTVISNYQIQQQKAPQRQFKCKKLFEESLSKPEPKKVTKCVDERPNNVGNIVEHLTEPKYEKDFIADVNTLKSVYLQNKDWLDDEISRRLKIEEELQKKYNEELKSTHEQNKISGGESISIISPVADTEVPVYDRLEKVEKDSPSVKKVTYADSLKSEQKPIYAPNKEQTTDDMLLEVLEGIEALERETKINPKSQKPNYGNLDSNYLLGAEVNHQNTLPNDISEKKARFRRNKEQYATNDDIYLHKNAREFKNMYKKEKQESLKNDYKQKGDFRKKYNSMDKTLENNLSEEDFKKDDRYIINKNKQDKKKGEYNYFNKKQKRKNKHNQSKVKADTVEKLKGEQDFISNISDEKVDFIDFQLTGSLYGSDDSVKTATKYKDRKNKGENNQDADDKMQKKNVGKEQELNWLEKRAVFRTEARKKYYEQFGETSPNNASWYFRRMRKREQCRSKVDNSTFRNNKKKNYTIKH